MVDQARSGTVLVTGGAGYIGSHTCVQLLEAGARVVVVDNLDNASPIAIDRVRELAGLGADDPRLTFHELDLRDGAVLWEGRARASSAEQQQSQSSLAGMLVAAVVNQIIGTTTDAGYNYAGMANGRLILGPEGVLYGPRSPRAGQPPAPVR